MSSSERFRGAWVAALALLTMAVVAGAQDAPDPDQFYKGGLVWQRAAQETQAPQESAADLQKAIQQYEQATRLRVDFYAAQAEYARCLYQLSRLTADTSQRRALLQAAWQRYGAAARCTGVDWKLFNDYGAFLAFEVDALAGNAQEKIIVLREAVAAQNKALTLAVYSSEKTRIQRDLGLCLVQLAQNIGGAHQKSALYEQAIANFDAATKAEANASDPRIYAQWGAALLQWGKISEDRLMIRQSIERLQTALDKNPNQNEARYNLVCAYALLDQPEPAVRHLRLCLQNDPQQVYLRTAAQDPDLNSLRRIPEFNDLLADKPTTAPSLLSRPSLSGR